MLSDAQILKKFGQPGENFAMLEIPYPMRIAWDLSHSVNRIQCHKFAIGSFLSVFSDLKAHYGYEKIKELGITKHYDNNPDVIKQLGNIGELF